ncbi:hypothetical protein FisN_15Lh194 [Fistulifera solaris]|uniref:BTB domain-containing protein n=1 Tax=Fistulifera solaris TaxID=1519565 RepID=A0A1Z5JDN8_FISSO|nr:hypothetical protein FisN_15Lh194 [Fistulifera solaris]|eukprot:GAX12113.1 hypothetical protein FisN_15Lh194 [Fistulifera solaris]
MNVDEIEPGQAVVPRPEEEEDDEDDEEEDRVEENDGLYDGGVAEPVERPSERRSAIEADIVLFFSCSDPLVEFRDHPILKPGIVVQIGLDKNTKLGTVFERFVEFCNEKRGASKVVALKDLEFSHSELLSPHDKAEDAALMKNDRITVRAESSKQRQADMNLRRLQRDIDRNFFIHLRSMLPIGGVATRYADVELDCQGVVVDESGTVQRLITTGLQCHAGIVSKRCPWLGRMIASARHEQDRRSVVSVDATPNGQDSTQHTKIPPAILKGSEDEDEIEPMNVHNISIRPNHMEAAEIEIDDDDDLVSFDEENQQEAHNVRNEMDDSSVASDLEVNRPRLLRVTIPNYGPDAVRILVEYIYTNRVESLGFEAFVKASTKFLLEKVNWESREPTVTFQTALSALLLAEEAALPRLALMCEVAAAQLVGVNTVVDALEACESQKRTTGNELPFLRKAAMEIVLRSSPRGVFSLPTFRQALEERSRTLVPTLLTGTADIMQKLELTRKHSESGSKRDWRAISQDYFSEMDYVDAVAREKERFKNRVERRKSDLRLGPLSVEDELKLFEKPKRKEVSRRRSMKGLIYVVGGTRGRTAAATRRISRVRFA